MTAEVPPPISEPVLPSPGIVGRHRTRSAVSRPRPLGGTVGVMSTYCQICGLPVQHDHYVPAEDGDYFHIWRGDGSDACEPIVAFGPGHAWLRQAVGLPFDDRSGETPVAGAVHDGYLTDGEDDFDVTDGFGDRVALHGACWRLAGRPIAWEPLEHL